ncbi:hypothetical protein GTQ34_11740 [Muricauda sp. JGD-17]|uniref:Uncharacterized protein n=1 Tax=Flagellimonas ochracea TaxID=2696472 RepID=A0A964WXZ2_9FLAO|nr:hypothetical protein [Allomuricauda ochracea]NAY92590.1 hypothetical protein [Allomuricauda ochracea]
MSQIRVPRGQNQILLDGRIDSKEWRRAETITIEKGSQIRFLQDDKNLYIAVEGRKKWTRYVDLYLKQDAVLTNLHASMQLGERMLKGNWNDTLPKWNWGNNTDWKANTVKIISDEEDVPLREALASYDGFEFQISKERMTDNELLIRVEFRDFEGKAPDIIFPEGTSRYTPQQWLRLDLK